MRTSLGLATIAAALGLACGGSGGLTAPPPMELSFVVTMSPDAAGGMRSQTIVSAVLFENEDVRGVLQSAEFTVFDAQGGVLTRQPVAGPLTFGTDRTIRVQQVLDWTPAEALGRSLKVRFDMVRPSGVPLVIERTVTF